MVVSAYVAIGEREELCFQQLLDLVRVPAFGVSACRKLSAHAVLRHRLKYKLPRTLGQCTVSTLKCGCALRLNPPQRFISKRAEWNHNNLSIDYLNLINQSLHPLPNSIIAHPTEIANSYNDQNQRAMGTEILYLSLIFLSIGFELERNCEQSQRSAVLGSNTMRISRLGTDGCFSSHSRNSGTIFSSQDTSGFQLMNALMMSMNFLLKYSSFLTELRGMSMATNSCHTSQKLSLDALQNSSFSLQEIGRDMIIIIIRVWGIRDYIDYLIMYNNGSVLYCSIPIDFIIFCERKGLLGIELINEQVLMNSDHPIGYLFMQTDLGLFGVIRNSGNRYSNQNQKPVLVLMGKASTISHPIQMTSSTPRSTINNQSKILPERGFKTPSSMTQIPVDWFCPLSHQVMTDPVTASDGYTYQRKSIQEWVENNNTSPTTQEVLKSKNLLPNLALKSTIDNLLPEYLSKGCSTKLSEDQIKERQYSPVGDELGLAVDSIVHEGELVVSVTVQPPSEQLITNRKSVSVICVLDISGSMDTQASEAASGAEENGFTRLDLVKHSINTIINSLGSQDLLALVPFSDNAHVAFDLTRMDANGKETAQKTLKNINTAGSTNIWDGVRVGLELTKDERCDSKNTFVILLTDGEPNINPPEGILPSLAKFIDSNGLVSNLHVFGYGYNLDTVLLTGIATLGLGTYGYIPDCSMVGTIFINFLSNALANVTNLVQVKIEPSEDVKLLSTGGKQQPMKVVNLGGVQYGQKRTILFRFSIPQQDKNFLEVYLNYGNKLRKQRHVSYSTTKTKYPDQLLSEINRITHIETLLKALGTTNKFENAIAVILNGLSILENSPVAKTDQLTQMIIRDITSPNDQEGQVSKAFEKKEWFNKWGKHYIPALILAHSQQICTNFKDPGLQSYGGKLFKELQNQIDTVFIKLPPPEPTVKKHNYVAPANMAQYNNYYGGCIDGNCDALMGDGTLKKIKDLAKGDSVKTPTGSTKILCVVKSTIKAVIPMIHFPRGLVITPYHPVKINKEWCFPASVGRQVKSYVTEYFNFVLEEDHSMIVNGMECVSLGHGFTGSAVIEHEYLGTQKVIEDLKSYESWESGRVDVAEFMRDPVSHRITKMLIK